MATDAFTALVSRALRTEVESVEVERVATTPLAEVDRVRWRARDTSGILLFKRMPRVASVEAALVPYLARRGVPVPTVLASGIPPAHVREPRPWLLIADVGGAPLASVATPELAREAARILLRLHRATEGDATLTALGVPTLPASRIRAEALDAAELLDPPDAERLRSLAARVDVAALESLDTVLVHGDYGGESLRVADGKLLVLEWARAHLGCPLQDLARLCVELGARDPALAHAAREAFDAPEEQLAAAESLQELSAIRWFAWQARKDLAPRDEARALIRGVLGAARR